MLNGMNQPCFEGFTANLSWFSMVFGVLVQSKRKKKISTHVLESTFSHWHSYLEFVMYDMHYCKCITRHGHLFFYTPIGLMLCLMNLSTCNLFALWICINTLFLNVG